MAGSENYSLAMSKAEAPMQTFPKAIGVKVEEKTRMIEGVVGSRIDKPARADDASVWEIDIGND